MMAMESAHMPNSTGWYMEVASTESVSFGVNLSFLIFNQLLF